MGGTTIKLDRNAFLAWHETLPEETKLEISLTIMQEFAKKHLKPLENHSIIKDTIQKEITRTAKAAEAAIQKEIQDQIGTLTEKSKHGWGTKEYEFAFNPIFKEKLDKNINMLISKEETKILTKANEMFEERQKELESRFERHLNYTLKEYEASLEKKMKNHFEALLSKYLTLGTGE